MLPTAPTWHQLHFRHCTYPSRDFVRCPISRSHRSPRSYTLGSVLVRPSSLVCTVDCRTHTRSLCLSVSLAAFARPCNCAHSLLKVCPSFSTLAFSRSIVFFMSVIFRSCIFSVTAMDCNATCPDEWEWTVTTSRPRPNRETTSAI